MPRRAWVAAAAALLLVVGGASAIWGYRAHGAAVAAAARPARFGLLVPAGEVAAAPQRFHWEPVRGAARYRVRLMEADGTAVWSAESLGTSADAPPTEELASAMAPGRPLLWEVTAYDARGVVIGAAGPAGFHVALGRIR